jgi:CO/xanthine dehydrogenase Mo-binding subunit
VVDELAEKLGIDPIEFRLRNGVREGDRRADGPEYKRIGLVETLEAAAATRTTAHRSLAKRADAAWRQASGSTGAASRAPSPRSTPTARST